MILINEVQKSTEDVAKLFNVDLNKLRKEPVFKINEDLKGYDLGSRKKRETQPNPFPAFFFGEDSRGMNLEIRYAASKSNMRDKDSKKLITIYSPRKVRTEGDLTLATKLDLAFYMYIHPKNRQSPFRKPDSVWTYEFVDNDTVAQTDLNRGTDMLSALNHANKAPWFNLPLIAKGMGVANVDNMKELQIRAALSNLALTNPAAYLLKVNKNVTVMDGRILDAVDKNIFVLDQTYGTPRWLWNAGKNKGQMVCEVTNQSVGASEFLIAHIKDNLPTFYVPLMTIQDEQNVNDKAEEFLIANKKVEEVILDTPSINLTKAPESELEETDIDDEEENFDIESKEDFPEESTLDDQEEFEFENKSEGEPNPDFPTDFKSAMNYLAAFKGSNPANVAGKKLLEAIAEEDLQPSTIRLWVKVNMGY